MIVFFVVISLSTAIVQANMSEAESTKVDPDCIAMPVFEELNPDKNKECWFKDAEDDETDWLGPRQIWVLEKCPFTPAFHPTTNKMAPCCSAESWKRAACWSTIGTDNVLNYLIHHVTNSTWHRGSKSGTCMSIREAYDNIMNLWATFEWTTYEDTFQDRSRYRAELQKQKQEAEAKKQKQESTNKKQRGKKRSFAEEPAADDHQSDADEALPSDAKVINQEQIRQMIREVRAEEVASSSTDAPLQRLGKRRAQATAVPKALAAVTGLGQSGDLRVVNINDDAREVSVPVGRLKLIQESLQRAEHAITSSLANTAEQGNKLINERLIVMNAIDVISEVTGNTTRHYGHGPGT